MNKLQKGLSLGLILIPAILFIIYILLGFYYMEGFPCFTWINGVYCTGKTVSQVNEELLEKTEYEGLGIIDRDGAKLFVDANAAGFKMDYTPALMEVYNDRNPFAWGKYVFNNKKHYYEPSISLDRNKFEEIVGNWEIFVDPKDIGYYLDYDPVVGYSLKGGTNTVPDKEKIVDLTYRSMLGMEALKDLSNFPECYSDVPLSENDKRLLDLFEKIDMIQSLNVTYEFDSADKAVLDSKTTSGWILRADMYDSLYPDEDDDAEGSDGKENDKNPGSGLYIIGESEVKLPDKDKVHVSEGFLINEDGNLIVSEEKIYDYLSNITSMRDTGWMLDKYQRGEGTLIALKEGHRYMGSVYDVDKEYEHLKEELLKCEKHTPEDISFAYSDDVITFDAAEKLGDRYIEVNFNKQYLKYYVDGNVYMEMPVVTGNVNRRRGSPAGIYNVYNKRYHTYLRGEDYVSYVNYWLGVYKGVGIHDATWRSKFGEEIYKSDGSHGCINCPLQQAEELWNEVEVGVPVVMYY